MPCWDWTESALQMNPWVFQGELLWWWLWYVPYSCLNSGCNAQDRQTLMCTLIQSVFFSLLNRENSSRIYQSKIYQRHIFINSYKCAPLILIPPRIANTADSGWITVLLVQIFWRQGKPCSPCLWRGCTCWGADHGHGQLNPCVRYPSYLDIELLTCYNGMFSCRKDVQGCNMGDPTALWIYDWADTLFTRDFFCTLL